jgi:cytochrome b
MLLLLLAQALSGLFNSDDVLYNGPLYYAAETPLRDVMGVAHEWLFDILLALVALHVAVVAYHQWIRRDGMISAMIRGSAPGRTGRSAPVAWWLALLIAAVLGCLLWWGLEQAPQPAPVWF